MCQRCSSSGHIVAKRKDNGCFYGFQCNSCETAKNKNLSKLIPVWDERLGLKFELEPHQVLSVPVIKKPDHAMKAANDNTLDEEHEKKEEDYSEENIPW